MDLIRAVVATNVNVIGQLTKDFLVESDAPASFRKELPYGMLRLVGCIIDPQNIFNLIFYSDNRKIWELNMISTDGQNRKLAYGVQDLGEERHLQTTLNRFPGEAVILMDEAVFNILKPVCRKMGIRVITHRYQGTLSVYMRFPDMNPKDQKSTRQRR